MTIPRLIIWMLVGVVMWLCIILVAGVALAHAGPTAKAPDPAPIIWPQGPCNLQHRMDIDVVDGLLFECVCTRLYSGYECTWWIIAGVPASEHRRIKRRHAPRVTRVYVKPVVA